MVVDAFFEERREQSRIKAEIVAKYFWAWARVIMATLKRRGGSTANQIAYVDLFAGRGRYSDGSPSTPLLVLTKVIKDPELRNRLVVIFNDKDGSEISSLEKEIAKMPELSLLATRPQFFNEEVSEKLAQILETIKLIPTLCFIDPLGYKGISLRLISSVLKDWGSDCIVFFNYNRISMGLNNPRVVEHMNALFGEERAIRLRECLQDLSAAERETTIINELKLALEELGGKYVLPFRFKNEYGIRTSHYLIFVSKHGLGYGIMKEIMAKYSSTRDQGVPSFEYNPADERYPALFELSRPLDDLPQMLLQEFAGKTLTVGLIYDRHNVGRRFIKRNY